MAHARHESSQQRTTPALAYAKLLAVVYKRLSEEWGVPASWEECLAYGRSVRDWPAFEDSVVGSAIPQEALQARHPVQRRQ
jgi:2-haloacid dehalogenase